MSWEWCSSRCRNKRLFKLFFFDPEYQPKDRWKKFRALQHYDFHKYLLNVPGWGVGSPWRSKAAMRIQRPAGMSRADRWWVRCQRRWLQYRTRYADNSAAFFSCWSHSVSRMKVFSVPLYAGCIFWWEVLKRIHAMNKKLKEKIKKDIDTVWKKGI